MSRELPDLSGHPAAWFGPDMAVDTGRWVHSLTRAEVNELEAAAERFLASGVDLAEITIDQFDLPTMASRLAELRASLLHGPGFSLWRGLPVQQYSIEFVAAIYVGIGAHLGVARSQNAAGHLLGHVKDTGQDLADPRVRIYQTTQRQTFHTDSTDVVGLLCLADAKEGGESLLASSLTVYGEMKNRHPDLVRHLFEVVATDRRGEVPEGQNAWFEIPVLNWHQGFLTTLYHREYINSAARFETAPSLTEPQVSALDAWDSLANDPSIYLRMHLEPGDMQFVYNHHLMHDRTRFIDWEEPAKRRHLLRLWLSIPGDRPLPEVFAQRYGSVAVGRRGGIITSNSKLHVPLSP
ncbi:MAG: TauD/TfdA family dioxygenase [Granulosicoccus sp.]|nr:TauD/TfdA family dioxygenase [Granulosicoccus sp.]